MYRSILFLASAVLAAACSPSADETEPREERDASAHPGGAIYRWQQRLNEDGRIPRNAMVIAKGQRDAVVRRAITEDAAPPLISNWTWRGPGNVGGRIRGILIHPTNTKIMWIGSASGGVWMTTNGGGSWSPLNDFLPSLTIGCMAMDPADPTKLYIGTGEGFFNTVQGSTNTAAIQGAGIFVSTDSGAHWNQLPFTSTPDFYFVNRIAIDPNNSQIILAATGTGIWRTTDGGTFWSQRTTLRTMDLDFHPTDSMKAVAGATTGFSQFSTDGGQSWTSSSGFGVNATRVEIAYARSDPDIVYASVTDNVERIRIWRSTNGGQSFVRRTPDNPSDFDGIRFLSLYTNALWVDPTNPDRLLFAGVNIFSSLNGGISWLSRDGSTHTDHHIIVEHPNFDGVNNLTVFEGNDGGIYRRDAPFVRSDWFELNNNLGITQFYGGAVNPTSGVILAGTQDNGTQRWNGDTETWTRQIGGDGGFCAADPTNANVFYGETQRLIIRRSTDGGFNFSNISNGIGDAGNSSRVNFIPSCMLGPNESNRMLAAGRELWRSNNVKTGNPPIWSSIKAPIGCTTDAVVSGPPQSHYNSNSECNISTIVVAQGNPDIIWVGHNNGSLYKTKNGTAATPTWRDQHHNTPTLPHRWISRIVIDARDHDRVYVSYLGYSDDSIWRTVDGGQNWVDISGSGSAGIPEIPVASFAIHPRMPGALLAGTDMGLFVSIDDGNTWSTSDAGPGGVAIDELVWKNDITLLVVTHGRGIYEVDTQVQLASHQFVGFGCAVSGISTLTSDEPIIGATQTYNVAGVSPNSLYAFAYGPAGAPTDLGNGCVVQPDLRDTIVLFLGLTSPMGAATIPVPIPSDTSLIGAVLVTQVLTNAPGGPLLGIGELTNGLQQTLGF